MAPPADRLIAARSARALVAEARRYLPLAGLPPGQRLARVVTGAGALMVALALALLPLTAGGDLAPLQALIGAMGVAALLICVLGWPAGIGGAVALLAVDYGITLVGRPSIDPAAPLEAAGLLLAAELAAWSLECRTRAPDGPGVLTWRLGRLALAEIVALLCGAAVLAAGGLPAHGGTTLGAVGVASAVAVLLLAAVALHRLRRPAAALTAPRKTQPASDFSAR